MRILQVTSGFPPELGGVESSVYELVRRLRVLNHEVRVITGGITEIGLKDGVWRLPTLHIERSWGDLCFCPSILNALRKTPFDVVHAHTPRKLFAEAVAFYKLLSKRKFPYIVSIRLVNTSLPGFTAALANVYQNTVGRAVLQRAKYVVVQTKANRQHLAQNYRIDPEKIEILPNAVDTEFFDPSSFRATEIKKKYSVEDNRVVLFAGRLTTQKGLNYLLGAIPSIIKALPDVKLFIVGEGPEEVTLKREAARLGVSSNIVFIGKVSHEEMPELYSVADVFVSPSLSESFSNVMLEAMAMQNPLVITKVGVAPEILEDYKTALLIQPADSRTLASKIIELLMNPALSRSLGRKAREFVRREYSWELVVNRSLRLYEKALN